MALYNYLSVRSNRFMHYIARMQSKNTQVWKNIWRVHVCNTNTDLFHVSYLFTLENDFMWNQNIVVFVWNFFKILLRNFFTQIVVCNSLGIWMFFVHGVMSNLHLVPKTSPIPNLLLKWNYLFGCFFQTKKTGRVLNEAPKGSFFGHPIPKTLNEKINSVT